MLFACAKILPTLRDEKSAYAGVETVEKVTFSTALSQNMVKFYKREVFNNGQI